MRPFWSPQHPPLPRSARKAPPLKTPHPCPPQKRGIFPPNFTDPSQKSLKAQHHATPPHPQALTRDQSLKIALKHNQPPNIRSKASHSFIHQNTALYHPKIPKHPKPLCPTTPMASSTKAPPAHPLDASSLSTEHLPVSQAPTSPITSKRP